jgi:hypothetical protein
VFSLALALFDHLGRLLGKLVKQLGRAVTFRGSPIELLRKLPMDRATVKSISLLRPRALFHRSRTVIVGVVGHGRQNEHASR